MVYILPLVAIDLLKTPIMLIGFTNLFSPLGFFIGMIVAQVNIRQRYIPLANGLLLPICRASFLPTFQDETWNGVQVFQIACHLLRQLRTLTIGR
jgi:hypothetical protein